MEQQEQVIARRQSPEERQEQWRGIMDAWRQSGLSKAAFCRQRDIGVWRFHYWARRLAEIEEHPGGGFARVAPAGSGLRLVLAGGLCLEVEPGFDSATLKRFLAALASAC